MPGAVIGNPTPAWLKPENASVLDPLFVRFVRALVNANPLPRDLEGILPNPNPASMVMDPQAQALALMMPMDATGGGIKAFHGSPHDFDKFSLSKIGTGEGAQAYGHGLYFADSPAVAKTYQDALASRRGAMIDGVPLETFAKRLDDSMMSGAMTDSEATITEQKLRFLTGLDDPNFVGTFDDAVRDASRDQPQIAEWAKSLKYRPGGRMYEVSINADPDQLLDWDKPLSQQGMVGQKVAKSLKPNVWEKQQIEGAEKTLREYPQTKKYQQDPAAGEEYLDRVREHLAGLTNYKGATGKEAWERTMRQNNMAPTAASAALRKRGIPGIKYLDGGSRAAGEGSRNYVIFDDALVSILKKYGVALPVIEGLRRKAAANGGSLPEDDVRGVM